MSYISGGGGGAAATVNVVSTVDLASTSTTSATPVATTTTVNITASKTGAKIMIIATGELVNLTPNANSSNAYIFKDGVNLSSNPFISAFDNNGAGAIAAAGGLCYLDTSADTNSHTYAVYIASTTGGDTTRWNNTGTSSTGVIIAMEVH